MLFVVLLYAAAEIKGQRSIIYFFDLYISVIREAAGLLYAYMAKLPLLDRDSRSFATDDAWIYMQTAFLPLEKRRRKQRSLEMQKKHYTESPTKCFIRHFRQVSDTGTTATVGVKDKQSPVSGPDLQPHHRRSANFVT